MIGASACSRTSCSTSSVLAPLSRRTLGTLPSRCARSLHTSSAAAAPQTPRSAAASPPSRSAYSRQRRREWVIVGVTGSAAATFGYYWYSARQQPVTPKSSPVRSFSLSSPPRTSFSIPVRAPQGGTMPKIITSLTAAEVDQRLRAEERTTHVDRPEGACLVARYDTNSVASNDPIEDKRAEVIVERDRAISTPEDAKTATGQHLAKGDLCFFAVMDGHAGYHTSTYLSQKLIAFVALELDKVFREAGEYREIAQAKARMPIKLWRSVFGGLASNADGTGLDGDPEVMRRAIAKAFRSLDKEIVNTPVELLKEYELSLASTSSSSTSDLSHPPGSTRSLSSLAHSIFPTGVGGGGSSVFTATQRTAYEAMMPAMSGSCALLTYIDSARNDVYIACTGDSRAIAGWFDEAAGKWTVETLSVDQTGRNPAEVARMQSEHPASEADRVIMRGRVLGGLEPTRAFGDARYKWERSVQDRLYDTFLPGGRASTRGAPRGLETPPYVTAQPVVEWRRVDGSGSSGSSAGSKGSLRFIVMATDGLWDMMSNEEVGSLVAGHLAGVRGSMLASTLYSKCYDPASLAKTQQTPESDGNSQVAAADAQKAAAEHKQHPLSKLPEHLRAFAFEDENLATHLIRNALGGANTERVAGLLAIPAPESRRYRDDITVNVILFNTPSLSNETKAKTLPPSNSPAKAAAADKGITSNSVAAPPLQSKL